MADQIRIELPLRQSVTSALLAAIGQMWPDAKVITRDTPADRLVIEVAGDAPDPANISITDALAHTRDDGGVDAPEVDGPDVETFLASLRDGVFSISTPEWFTRFMLGVHAAALEDMPESENYIEQTLYDPDTHKRWVVIVGQPDGRTPHELRRDAEARSERLERLVAMYRDGAHIYRDSEGRWRHSPSTATQEAGERLDLGLASLLDAAS